MKKPDWDYIFTTSWKAHLPYLPLILQLISTVRRPYPSSCWTVTVSIIPLGLGLQRAQFQVSKYISRKNIYIFLVLPLSHGLFFEVCLLSLSMVVSIQMSLVSTERAFWAVFLACPSVVHKTLTWTIFSWDRKSLHEISRTTFHGSLGSPAQEDCLEEQGKMEGTVMDIFTLSYPESWMLE